MKLARIRFPSRWLGLAALGTVVLATPALANKDVAITVDPPAFTTPGNVPEDISGNGNATFYVYTVTNGGSITDTIPVSVCMTGYQTGWNSVDVEVNAQGGNLPGLTLPANQTFLGTATTPDCRTMTIGINTGALNLGNPLVAQNFVANINLGAGNPDPSTGNNKPQIQFSAQNQIQIRVAVLPVGGDNISCFLTDSSGNLLGDCAGMPVGESGSDDGRFQIVANKRNIEVATNPGQFYYNIIWRNTTGASETVGARFVRTGVDPNGTQALHAAVFNGYLQSLTTSEFDSVNSIGKPEGKDDAVTNMVVPAGSSLLITYHLTWNGLGKTVPTGCATNCPAANQLMKVKGTLTGAIGGSLGSCETSALGYRKSS